MKIKKENNLYYWGIAGLDTDENWVEIPKNLYVEIRNNRYVEESEITACAVYCGVIPSHL